MNLSDTKLVRVSFETPLTSTREVPKTDVMKRDHFDGDENIIAIHNGEWRLRDRRGRVKVSIPIATYPFSELAVLDVDGETTLHYAARVGTTDHWAHFYYLQAWMYPIVAEYLTMQRRYDTVTDLIDRTQRALRGAE